MHTYRNKQAKRLGAGWKGAAIRQTDTGKRFRWRDRLRRIHAVELWPLEWGSPETTASTRCGLYDIPPGEGWTGDETPTCPSCAYIEGSEDVAKLKRAIRIMRRA